MPERADAADTLGHVDELVVIARLHELLEAAVDEADLRNRLDDGLVLHHEIEVQRLGQHRMLGAERDDGRLSHATHLPFLFPSSPLRARLASKAAFTLAAFSGSRFAIFSSTAACFAAASFLAFAATGRLDAGNLLGIHAGQARVQIIGARSLMTSPVGLDFASGCSPRTRPPRLRSALLGGFRLGHLPRLLASRLLLRRDDGHGLFLRERVEVAAEVDGDALDVHAEQIVRLVLEHERRQELIGDAGYGRAFFTPLISWFVSTPSFMNEYTRSMPSSVFTHSICTKRAPSAFFSAASAGRPSMVSGMNSDCRVTFLTPLSFAPAGLSIFLPGYRVPARPHR